jgi:hypothetical protein
LSIADSSLIATPLARLLATLLATLLAGYRNIKIVENEKIQSRQGILQDFDTNEDYIFFIKSIKMCTNFIKICVGIFYDFDYF